MKDISFDVTKRDNYFSDNKESHEDIEIYYLKRGQRLYFVENKTYFLQEGSVILVGSNRIHKTSVAKEISHERMLLRVYPSFLQRLGNAFPDLDLEHLLLRDAVVCTPSQPCSADIRRLFELIEALVNEKPLGYQEEISCATAMIFLMLQRLPLTSEDEEIVLNPKSQKVYEIAKYLSNNMNSISSLDELCDTLYISKSFLCHGFKEITGMSVISFLNAIRMRHAKMLLEESELSIAEIARSVGFDNIARFSNLFKRSEGYAPRDYRRMKATNSSES